MEKYCCASRGCSSSRCDEQMRKMNRLSPRKRGPSRSPRTLCSPAFHPDFGRNRPSVADVLDVTDLVATPQFVKISGQDHIAMEVQEPALLGHEEYLISFRRQLGHLTESPILGIVEQTLGLHRRVVLFDEFYGIPRLCSVFPSSAFSDAVISARSLLSRNRWP